MTTAQTKATHATNEWIADYCERHGENQATRTEAYDRIAELEKLADEARVLVGKYLPEDEQEDASDGILAYLVPDSEERYVAAHMVAALREKEAERMALNAEYRGEK